MKLLCHLLLLSWIGHSAILAGLETQSPSLKPKETQSEIKETVIDIDTGTCIDPLKSTKLCVASNSRKETKESNRNSYSPKVCQYGIGTFNERYLHFNFIKSWSV